MTSLLNREGHADQVVDRHRLTLEPGRVVAPVRHGLDGGVCEAQREAPGLQELGRFHQAVATPARLQPFVPRRLRPRHRLL